MLFYNIIKQQKYLFRKNLFNYIDKLEKRYIMKAILNIYFLVFIEK